MDTPDTFPLDDAAVSAIHELREQQKNAQIAINAIQFYFMKCHKLQGQWQLADNGRELIQQSPQTVP